MSRVLQRVAMARVEVRPGSCQRGSVQRRWLKRFGALGFSFFLLKGLLWLTVPALVAYFARR